MRLTQLTFGKSPDQLTEWKAKITQVASKGKKETRDVLDLGMNCFSTRLRVETVRSHLNPINIAESFQSFIGSKQPFEDISYYEYEFHDKDNPDVPLRLVNSSRSYSPIITTSKVVEDHVLSITIDNTRYQMLSYKTGGNYIKQTFHRQELRENKIDKRTTHVGCLLAVPSNILIDPNEGPIITLDLYDHEEGVIKAYSIMTDVGQEMHNESGSTSFEYTFRISGGSIYDLNELGKPMVVSVVKDRLEAIASRRPFYEGSISFRCEPENIPTELIFVPETLRDENLVLRRISEDIHRNIEVITFPKWCLEKDTPLEDILKYLKYHSDQPYQFEKHNVRACTMVDMNMPNRVLKAIRMVFVFKYETRTDHIKCTKCP